VRSSARAGYLIAVITRVGSGSGSALAVVVLHF
jgi:hypothetical protein